MLVPDGAEADDAAAADDPMPDLEGEPAPSPPEPAGSRGLPPADTAALAGAPPASQVVAAAYRAAGLAHDPTPAWRRRARLAGLVPTLSVRDGKDAAWRDVSDPTIAYVSVFSVGATWHLERLAFDPNELRISAIEAGRRRDRRRVAAVVIRTYYEWLRLRADAEREPRWALRADEAKAELDALTDGWFSQNLPSAPGAAQAGGR